MAALRLILLRHGEAEPGHGGPDHARRLTARGEAEVRKVARDLIALQAVPTFAMASDSARTKGTAVAVNLEFNPGLAWQFDGEFYLCGVDKIQAALAEVDASKHPTVLLLGHNPGFSAAGTLLTGRHVSLGTAAAAVMSIDAKDWLEAPELIGAWTLDRILAP